MDVPFSQRCISQRNTHNSNNVLLIGEEFIVGDVCTVVGVVVGQLLLPLMSLSPLPLDVLFFFFSVR